MEKTKYNQNQSVFKVGELPDKMYLLVKGSVGIFLPTNETNKPNFIIQENELFGEMGVIENELRMATARCLVESETSRTYRTNREKGRLRRYELEWTQWV